MVQKSKFLVTVANLLPEDYTEARFSEMKEAIIESMRYFGGYNGISENDATFLFPPDLSIESPVKPIIVSIRFYGELPVVPLHKIRHDVGLDLQSRLAFRKRYVVIDVTDQILKRA
jgi:hypothetical protein